MEIIDLDKDADFTPVCPYCEKELDKIYRLTDDKRWFEGSLGYCYACPHCRKILGFADSHV